MLRRLLEAVGVYKLYEKWLTNQVKNGQMPEHIAVILDGNRRWAIERSLPPFEGHKYGAKKAEEFLEWCLDFGVRTVTAYIFSTENFHRSSEEVNRILTLIDEQVKRLLNEKRLHENEVRVKAIGRLSLLPPALRESLKKLEDATKNYDKHYLNIAVAYGGRAEIVDAVKKIAGEVRENKLSPDQIDENLFGGYLYTAYLPNPYPDLIIRTSGEERLSGFLLWQSAYSELCFLDVFWPDFRKIDFLRAIRTYQLRKRKFGR
jgi:tritrans,polycis-undecaprenyl-diphosphate synthase [geranylgeranyl-diphosphate specific]